MYAGRAHDIKKELKVLWTAARPVELSWNELVFKAIREPRSIISKSAKNHEDIFVMMIDSTVVMFMMYSYDSCDEMIPLNLAQSIDLEE